MKDISLLEERIKELEEENKDLQCEICGLNKALLFWKDLFYEEFEKEHKRMLKNIDVVKQYNLRSNSINNKNNYKWDNDYFKEE